MHQPECVCACVCVCRGELRAALGGLPTPQNEYQIMAPEAAEEEEEAVGPEEDAAEVKARRVREEAARQAEEDLKRTQVRGGWGRWYRRGWAAGRGWEV